MGIAEVWAFFRALPELVKVMGEVVSTLKQLKQDQVNKELEKIKSEVATTLKQIEGAQTNEARKKLILELSLSMSK